MKASEKRNDGIERFTVAHVKDVMAEGGDYDVTVVASDATLDRQDEAIDPAGWDLDNFRRNPVILAAHMHRLTSGRSPVVGSAPLAEVRDGELILGIRFAETELGREYRSLYRDGHMRAVSVGFDPIEGAWQERDAGAGVKGRVWVHTRQELWETSCVAVGANPNALARMRAAAARLGADPWNLDDEALGTLAERIAERLGARAAPLAAEIADGPDLEKIVREAVREETAAVRDVVNDLIACLPDSVGLVQPEAPGPRAPGPAERGGPDGIEGADDVGGRASAKRLLDAVNP
ncbi:MAG TPA: HK97 family phage prohead protease [Phycisphaerae bacterium]|nr:HK97 family phage prohead protease [Phycisphaerae bacterium]HUX15117.1 HK97 family phage prohead protease [Phycisphaerae bacterium]